MGFFVAYITDTALSMVVVVVVAWTLGIPGVHSVNPNFWRSPAQFAAPNRSLCCPYVIFYGDFERPLRRRFREVFAKFSRSFSEKTAQKKIWK